MAIYRRLRRDRPTGLSQSIVTTLEKSNRSLPIDYLADLHGRRVADIQPYVNKLNAKGIIIIKPSKGKDYVSLAKSSRDRQRI